MVLTVDGIEDLLRRGIDANIALINECVADCSNNKHDKWQKANDLYYSLEGVDNPIVRAMLALRVASYAYEAHEMMERMLSQKSTSVGERKKIYGARLHAMEKREAVLATVASEAEKTLHEFVEQKYKDKNGAVSNKLFYLKEFKKLAESTVSLKDLRIDGSGSTVDDENRRKEEIITIMEQYKRIGPSDE